jgi:hypothetical protein
MGGPVNAHILGQWVSVATGRDTSEVTLFEDGSVQVEGTTSVELLAHVLAEWHNSLKGKIA